MREHGCTRVHQRSTSWQTTTKGRKSFTSSMLPPCLRRSRREQEGGSYQGRELVEITGIFSAIIIGLIIGALGRLIVPGKQHLPIWLKLVLGIIDAFVGGFFTHIFSSALLSINILSVLYAQQ